MHAASHTDGFESFDAMTLIQLGGVIARLPAVRREDWAQLAAQRLAGAFGSRHDGTRAACGVTPVVVVVDTRESGSARAICAGWAGQPDAAMQVQRGFTCISRSLGPAQGVVEALVVMLTGLGCQNVSCVACAMPGGTMQGALRVVALALVRATEFDARTTKVDGLAQVCEAMAGAAERALGCSEDRPWLTPHEVAVLDRLANGHTVEEIAAALHRSPHTIHDHVKSLHRKLGVERRAMLVSLAMGVAGPLEREVGRDAARVVEAKPSSGEASEASWRGGDLGTTHA